MNANAKDAIIVAGHAVFVGSSQADALCVSGWAGLFGAGYREGDEPPLYVEHVRAGVWLAAENPDAVLIFSGGQTRAVAGPLSEAMGYYKLAAVHEWWQTSVGARAACEEYARDSYENCRFGILRFRQLTGAWPRRVTVVSFHFKKARFDFHMETLKSSGEVRFEDYQFHGANDPPPYRLHGTEGTAEGSLAGEERTLAEFKKSPAGESEFLRRKRIERDPFQRIVPFDTNPYGDVLTSAGEDRPPHQRVAPGS